MNHFCKSLGLIKFRDPSGQQDKKNRQEGGEMGEVPAGEGEEKSSFPF
jgi:hypothetical protein